jgi:NodT family efflux transporter outer membrane factor (OMF) lipoprotein
LLKKASRVIRPRATSAKRIVAGLTLPLLLSACAVGPDFFRPSAPPNAGFTAEPLPATTAEGIAGSPASAAQKFVSGAPVSEQWWSLFGSPQLDALIAEAHAKNPTLEAADAAMRQAQELYQSQFGSLFPTVNGSFSQTRQKSANTFNPSAGPLAPYSLTTAQVQVSYAIDIFGEARRASESTKATAERARFQKQAAELTLTANVVTAAIQNAALRAQIQATEAVLDALNQQYSLLRKQLELGAVAEADVVTESVLVAQTQAQLPPLQRALAQNRNLLLALVGRYPNEALPGETTNDKAGAGGFDIASIHLPEQLPVSLPSALIDQRPDVRAAEAALHSASADVGVATAEMLPKIPLTASFGSSTSPIGDLFSAGTGIWSVGASVLQPIFHGGALLHQKHAAQAAFDAAGAQYRGTVIGAFQNVADVLRALQADADLLRAQTEAERAASSNLTIAKNAYDTGATSFLTLLDAQRTYQQARVALVQAQANRYADTAALFVALGGGWWNRPDADEVMNDKPRKAEDAR